MALKNEVQDLNYAVKVVEPLLADMAFCERFTSEALNRKFHGIEVKGIYRGFYPKVKNGLKVAFCEDDKKNTALVELDDVTITVQGVAPIEVTLKAGMVNYIVVDAFYKIGVLTSQVEPTSKQKAASLLVVGKSDVKPSHVTVCAYNVPKGATQVTDAMLVAGSREKSKIDNLIDKVNANDHAINSKVDATKAATDKKMTDTTNKLHGDMSALTANTNKKIDSTTATMVKANAEVKKAVDNALASTKTDIEKKLSVTQSGFSNKYDKTGGLISGNVQVNGWITASADITAFSDERIKIDIENIPDALDKVSRLNGVTYSRIDLDGKRETGLIAQELELVLPEAVTTSRNDDLDINDFKSVAYGKVVGLLVEAIKEIRQDNLKLKQLLIDSISRDK